MEVTSRERANRATKKAKKNGKWWLGTEGCLGKEKEEYRRGNEEHKLVL